MMKYIRHLKVEGAGGWVVLLLTVLARCWFRRPHPHDSVSVHVVVLFVVLTIVYDAVYKFGHSVIKRARYT